MVRLTVHDDHLGRYVLLKGPLKIWLKENQIPAVYTPVERGWMMRRERLADLVALAESQGLQVTMRGDRR